MPADTRSGMKMLTAPSARRRFSAAIDRTHSGFSCTSSTLCRRAENAVPDAKATVMRRSSRDAAEAPAPRVAVSQEKRANCPATSAPAKRMRAAGVRRQRTAAQHAGGGQEQQILAMTGTQACR